MTRSCDVRCRQARRPRCTCICKGRRHGRRSLQQVESKVSRTPLCMSCDHPIPWPKGVELPDGRAICEACLAWSRRVLLDLGQEPATPQQAAAHIDANR